MISVCKSFSFAASHLLPKHEGKCANLHGHNFELEVMVTLKEDYANLNPAEEGMVIDFNALSKIVEENIINGLDHSHLNDYFLNPTAENIISWMWQVLLRVLPIHIQLEKLRLYETSKCFVEMKNEN